MERNPLKIPVGPWLPDLPDFENPGSLNVRNVYPKTPKSYGPWASPAPYSSALGNRCQGGAAFVDRLGNVNVFAGDSTKLYRLVSGTTGWVDVSKAGGYNTPADGQWVFNYSNGLVTATNYNDPQQVFDLASSTEFDDLSANAPQARYGAIVKNFLMVGGTFDPVDEEQPQRVWWPALGDPTNWPTPGTTAAAIVQSSFNDLLGDNGFITGLVGDLGNADGAVFMEKAVYRIIYSGPPLIFDFPRAQGVLGCIAPNSVVAFGNMAYYMGTDDFYRFDGAESVPLGVNQWAKTFFADLDQGNLHRVVGAADPINKLIIWAYPGQGNTNGNPNHLLVYNRILERASIIDIECETVLRLLSIGYTLDELYTVLGYTLDNLPAPLDSRVWTGGLQLLSMFDTLHKLNYFSGPNLAPTVDTMEVQPYPGKRWRANGVRPMVDGGSPSCAIGHRELQQQAVTFTPAVPMNRLGLCPVRASGRYGRARITLPAESVFEHIYGVEIDGGPAGNR